MIRARINAEIRDSVRPLIGRHWRRSPTERNDYMNTNPMRAPTSLTELQKFVVNRPGWEIVRQSLYDTNAYAAAGQTQLTFFAVPVGQSSKTSTDTNMTLAGQLPTNQNFLVQSIECYFFQTRPSVAAQLPAAFGAQAIAQIVNDAYVFNAGGTLTFLIGSKNYLQEAPLQKFPASRQFHVEAALADVTTAGANLQSRIAFAASVGRPYVIDPNITLVSNQNFTVTLTWPEGVVALPSGNPARVVVSLEGVLARRSQ